MANDLIDLMREYRIDDTHVFGTLDDSDPAGLRIGPMLEEIHRLRTAQHSTPAPDVSDDSRERMAKAILRCEAQAYADDEFEAFWDENQTPVRQARGKADAAIAALAVAIANAASEGGE